MVRSPESTNGPAMAESTPTATRGSKASRVTQQAPGVGMRLRGQRGGEATVVVADRLAQGVVAPRPAEALDVLVLVERRHALCCELPANPVRLLDQADGSSAARSRQRRRDATRPAAGDEHVTGDLRDVPARHAALHPR